MRKITTEIVIVILLWILVISSMIYNPQFRVQFIFGIISLTFVSIALLFENKDLGLGISLVIAAYVVYNIVYTLVSTPAGRIADKLGPKRVFITGLLFSNMSQHESAGLHAFLLRQHFVAIKFSCDR